MERSRSLVVSSHAGRPSRFGRLAVRSLALALAAAWLASAPAHAQRKVEILKEEPPSGSVPYRKVVYVDDGTCPKGEVKEITGGSQERSIARTVRCVKRPN